MNSSINHRFQSAGKALVLGASALLVTLSAQAGTESMDPPANHQAVVVRYADLNLATAAGAQALYARISAAASRACGGQPGVHELHLQQQYRACYDTAMEKAVQKIDSARLQALYAEHRTTRSVG
jgi:UrcA family protein